MTKQTKPTVEKPFRVVINEPTRTAFDRAAVLLKAGYVFCPSNPPQTFEFLGQSTVTLVLGEPDAGAIEGAEASQSLALALQKLQEQRNAQAVEAETQEHRERLAKQAELAQEVAATQTRLKQLQQAQRAI